MRYAKLLAAVGASVLGSVVVVAMTLADRRWTMRVGRIVAQLRDGSVADAMPYSPRDLANVPPPVARYFAYALQPGQAIVRGARLRQTGTFAMRPEAWTPFAAVEDFATSPPGFFWDARIRTPALTTYVRDGYVASEGALFASIAALVPVASVRATPGIAAGELLRYLAEAVFMPTALLPRGGVSWSPIDATSARVTLTDASTTVSCVVDFGDGSEIVRVSAMRARDANAPDRLTPWLCHFSEYARIAGMMVPTTGEVAWILDDAPFAYWRGRIVDARYEFANVSTTETSRAVDLIPSS